MSRVDERIREEMGRLTRPVATDGAFEAVAAKRTRRRIVRRVQGAALAVAVVAGSVAGGLGLVRLFHEGSGPTDGQTSPAPVSSRPGGPDVEEFPAICDESFLRADTDGDGNLDEVFVYSPGKEEPLDSGKTVANCDGPEVGQHYVLHVSGNKDTVEGAPEPEAFYGIGRDLHECEQAFACRLYAAPDLDGDGADEIAVQVAEQGSTRSIAFYRVEHPAEDQYELVRVAVASPGDPEHGFAPGPAAFPLRLSSAPFQTIACVGTGLDRHVIAATAALTDPERDLYDVRYTTFRLDGSELEVIGKENHHDVGWGERLNLEEPNLCGAPLARGVS